MKFNINLDAVAGNELDELARSLKSPKSRLIREAINDFYLKEKRAKENLLFFVNLYNEGVISKDILFLLLPRRDAEAIVIGSKFGKEAGEIAKEISS